MLRRGCTGGGASFPFQFVVLGEFVVLFIQCNLPVIDASSIPSGGGAEIDGIGQLSAEVVVAVGEVALGSKARADCQAR